MDLAPAPAPLPPGRALPEAGTLTFLFTDVEGSTPLWERHEALMRVVAARHDALLDGIVGAHGGTRVRERGEGDSVFPAPDAAIAAALHRQSLLFGREHGSRDVLSTLLEGMAAATAALGQSRLAAQLGGASDAMRESYGGYTSHKDYQRHLRAALGEEAFAADWAEGRALPPEEALALALAPEEERHGVVASGSAARVPTYEG